MYICPRRVLLAASIIALASCAGPRQQATRARHRHRGGPERTAGDLCGAQRAARLEQIARRAAVRHGVEPELVLGVIDIESSFRCRARSSVGARGPMQLMPRTAASLAKRLHWPDHDIDDPRFNIEAGTYYLAYLLRLFDGNRQLALAAYNTGPTRVRRWVARGRSLPGYSRRYAAAVLAARARFSAAPVGGEPLHRAPDGVASPSATVAHRSPDRAALRELLRLRLTAYREDEPLPVENQ